jgi:hypothetical protein
MYNVYNATYGVSIVPCFICFIHIVAEHWEVLFVSVCVQPHPDKDTLTLHRKVFAMTGAGGRKEIKM